MAAVHDEVQDLGAQVIGVGPASSHQAKRLMDTTVQYQLLLDPNGHVAAALGQRRQPLLLYVFNLRAWLRWIRSFVRTRRQFRITGHYSEVPAVAVVAPGGDLRWVHRGRSIGDYPDVDDAIVALQRNTSRR